MAKSRRDNIVSKNVRFVSLDLLRGIAALAIVLFHSAHRLLPILDPLSVCVDLFFVLSGFVLAPIFPSDKSAKGNIKAFVLKRALRFWPMAVTALLVKLILTVQQLLSGWDPGPGQNSALSFVGAVFLLQIIYVPSVTWIVPLWSLSAEWFSNLIAIPILRRKSDALNGFAVFIGLALVGLGTYQNLNTATENAGLVGALAIGRALTGLFIGILLRKNLAKLSEVKLFNNLPYATLAFIALYILTYTFRTAAPFVAALFVSPLIVATALQNDAVINSPFNKVAKSAGNLSFGIYVWHVVVINVVHRTLLKFGVDTTSSLRNVFILLLIVFPATIVATILTQRFVEKPINQRFSRRSETMVIRSQPTN